MVKNGAVKTSAVGLILVVIVGLIVVFVPVTSEKIDVQCFTTPCPPIIETKTLFEMLTTPPVKEPVVCIEIFAPVCGSDGVTYSNSCFADGSGVQIVHDGECTGDEGMLLTEDPSAFCKIYPTASGC